MLSAQGRDDQGAADIDSARLINSLALSHLLFMPLSEKSHLLNAGRASQAFPTSQSGFYCTRMRRERVCFNARQGLIRLKRPASLL